jgi:hypothetical protein
VLYFCLTVTHYYVGIQGRKKMGDIFDFGTFHISGVLSNALEVGYYSKKAGTDCR